MLKLEQPFKLARFSCTPVTDGFHQVYQVKFAPKHEFYLELTTEEEVLLPDSGKEMTLDAMFLNPKAPPNETYLAGSLIGEDGRTYPFLLRGIRREGDLYQIGFRQVEAPAL